MWLNVNNILGVFLIDLLVLALVNIDSDMNLKGMTVAVQIAGLKRSLLETRRSIWHIRMIFIQSHLWVNQPFETNVVADVRVGRFWENDSIHMHVFLYIYPGR